MLRFFSKEKTYSFIRNINNDTDCAINQKSKVKDLSVNSSILSLLVNTSFIFNITVLANVMIITCIVIADDFFERLKFQSTI